MHLGHHSGVGRTMTTTIKTKTEIRQIIDQVLHDDANKNSNWSEMLASAFLAKQHHLLSEYLSHGKGFNDGSKKAFCQLLNTDIVLTKKGIDILIAQHCQIELEQLLNERKQQEIEFALSHVKEKVLDKFENGIEAMAWVDSLVEKGFNKIVKQNKKSYLVNDEGNGYNLKRALIREYAEALLAFSNMKEAA